MLLVRDALGLQGSAVGRVVQNSDALGRGRSLVAGLTVMNVLG